VSRQPSSPHQNTGRMARVPGSHALRGTGYGSGCSFAYPRILLHPAPLGRLGAGLLRRGKIRLREKCKSQFAHDRSYAANSF
jgi:hypothetical protein